MGFKIFSDMFFDDYNHKEKELSYFLSDEKREEEREHIFSAQSIKRIDVANIILNFVFCFISICFGIMGPPFLLVTWLVVGYILSDLLLTFVDNFVFHLLPLYRFKNMSYKKRCKEVIKTEKELEQYKDDAKMYNCNSGSCRRQMSCSECERLGGKLKKIIRNTEKYLSLQKMYIQEYEDKLNLKRLKEDTTFNNTIQLEKTKQTQFEELLNKLDTVSINLDEIDISKIKDELTDFYSSLNTKPERFLFLTRTFFIYFEELLGIIAQVDSVDVALKTEYIKKINSVIIELLEYTMCLKTKILDSTLRDIDLNINVLYQELQKENEGLKEGEKEC